MDTTCKASHGIATTVAHVIRRTYFDGTPHVDVARIEGATNFGAVVERRRAERQANPAGYAVADAVYACGCRDD